MDDASEVDIKDFYPPFAIKTLYDVSELFERTAGEWFSDVIITAVFKKISEYYDLFKYPKLNVKIMTYQSCLEIQDILKTHVLYKKNLIKIIIIILISMKNIIILIKWELFL